jgi:protein-S-isoprenylcysteine O-methyltransferase Ste14
MLKPAAGPIFFAVIALLLLAGSYAMWPEGFFSTPFLEMTTGMLLRAVASLILVVIGVEFLAALAIVSLSDNQ